MRFDRRGSSGALSTVDGWRPAPCLGWLLSLSLLLLPVARIAPSEAQETLPARLTSEQFWGALAQLSENDGSFISDNFTSNELQMQQLVPPLLSRVASGGIYLGVGPEQNYTYIAAVRPRMAFIIDIRRQNMMLHLMYKASMEMSETRADFLARLFSRERPSGLDTATTTAALLDAFSKGETSQELFRKNLDELFDRLVSRRGFRLTPGDSASLHYVYSAFHEAGVQINYSFRPGVPVRPSATTFALLMTTPDSGSINRSFLATEESYRFVRNMHLNNLILPIVGDFAGAHAIRAVAAYLKPRGAAVSAFYVSNVESYLFREDAWARFIENVAALPLDTASLFIRPNLRGGSVAVLLGAGQDTVRVDSLRARVIGLTMEANHPPFAGILRTIEEYRQGRIRSYADVLRIGGG